MVAIDRQPKPGRQDVLSALADGEIPDALAEQVIDHLLGDPVQRERWLIYHAQADAMRFPTPSSLEDRAFLDRLSSRLASEPIHMQAASRAVAVRTTRWRRVWIRYGMPGAAAAAAVAVVSWMTYPYFDDREPSAGQLMAAQGMSKRADAPEMVSQDYLLAHQQFAPSSRLHGVAPYVRTASATVPVTTAASPVRTHP